MKLTDDDRIKYMHGHITTEEDVNIEGDLELSRLFTHGDLHVEGILECDSIRAARITGSGMIYADRIELAGNIDIGSYDAYRIDVEDNGELFVTGKLVASDIECSSLEQATVECRNLRCGHLESVDVFATGDVSVDLLGDNEILDSHIKADRVEAVKTYGCSFKVKEKDITKEFEHLGEREN